MNTSNRLRSLTDTALISPTISLSSGSSELQIATRNSVFDTLLRDNWRESIPTRVNLFSADARRWIAELKTRFLTNPHLTSEKTQALIDLILWHEAQIMLQLQAQKNIPLDGRPDIGNLINGITLDKMNNFLHIQIYTREIEKHIAKLEGNKILSHGYVADFLRDIHTLQTLGLKAPHIAEILTVIDSHPNLEFDEAILEKYRNAVKSALNAHYWMKPELQDTSLIQPNTDISVTPLKGHSGVPIPHYRETSQDDHARDFSLSLYPVSIIDAMSSFNREIIYDLTRTTPPVQKKRFFARHRKPDYTRITSAQDVRLKELLNIS
jgi:hypothetical protein